MIMSTRFTTPRQLEGTLESHLRRAGYGDAVSTRETRYVTESGRACLRASFYKYGSVLMDLETLKSYEAALRELPGVVRTQIIHATGRTSLLRDQVIVIHLRMWEEPDS